MLKLSRRLQTIAEYVPSGSRLADIGSDHGLLPVYLAQQEMISSGIASEVNEGPRDAAAKQVQASGLRGKIDVRLGDGLESLQPGEVDVITIAGMGGALIASILERGLPKLEHVSRLILQPNVGEHMVREWLRDHHWLVEAETILEEDGKIYEIIAAVPEERSSRSNEELYQEVVLSASLTLNQDWLYKFGPYLVKEASTVWQDKWREEAAKLHKVADQLAQSKAEASKQKRQEVLAEARTIEEVLACMPRAEQSFS